MSDFPRGWTLSSHPGGGVAASITVPAIAGVVHVLDAFTASMVNTAAAANDSTITLTSSDGVFAGFVLADCAAGAASNGESSESGLDLAAGPGASLTVAFSAAAATLFETLLIQGHDI